MEAKDTVMSSQDIKQIKSEKWGEPARNYDYTIEELMVAEAQAEISFKAGYDQAVADSIPLMYKAIVEAENENR